MEKEPIKQLLLADDIICHVRRLIKELVAEQLNADFLSQCYAPLVASFMPIGLQQLQLRRNGEEMASSVDHPSFHSRHYRRSRVVQVS